MITPATPSAANASRLPSQGMLYFTPTHGASNPEDHDESAPHVGRVEMQRIGFQGFARIISSPRDSERVTGRNRCLIASRQDDDGRDAWSNAHLCGKEAFRNASQMIYDRRQEQQSRFHKRGKTLHLSVTIEVLRVGWFVRHTDGEIGDDGRHQVQARM